VQEMEVPEHLIDLIRNLSTKSRAAIRVDDTLSKSLMEDVRDINAFEMWVYRRMLGIFFIEKRTNISILDMLKQK